MGGRADHDGGGPDRVGILGDQPTGCAVIGGMQENLAFGGDVVCGELLQMPAHHSPGGAGVLHIDPGVARRRALLGVDYVDRAAAGGRQSCGGLRHQGSHRRPIDGGENHATGGAVGGGRAARHRHHRHRCRQGGPRGAADLLGLDSFRFPEQAMGGGQERDSHRDHGRADEEGNVNVEGDNEPAGGVGRQAA